MKPLNNEGSVYAALNDPNPESSTRSNPIINSMESQITNLRLKWEDSCHGKYIISQIRNKILVDEKVVIDRVLWLGLSSLEKGVSDLKLEVRKGTGSGKEKENAKAKTDKNGRGNRESLSSMCQLLIFEMVLIVLREKFTIEGSNIWFLDPQFSDADIDFLERRGYAAAAKYATLDSFSEGGYREAEGDSKEMLASITTSTLFVAFGLDTDISVKFVCAREPCLYFSNELVALTAFAPLYHPKSKVHHLMPKFETFAFSRELLAVDMYVWDEDEAKEEDCGLMWEVGVKDEVWEVRTQKRLMKAVESWKWWDESMKGMERKREGKKRSKRDKQFSPF